MGKNFQKLPDKSWKTSQVFDTEQAANSPQNKSRNESSSENKRFPLWASRAGSLSRWQVADADRFTSTLSDIIGRLCPRCQVERRRGGEGAETSQTSKELELGRKKRSKKTDLSNVNCHLTPTSTTSISSTGTAVPPGPSSRSGVERELNQGFSCYKRLRATAGRQKQKATRRLCLFVLGRGGQAWLPVQPKFVKKTDGGAARQQEGGRGRREAALSTGCFDRGSINNHSGSNFTTLWNVPLALMKVT